VKIQRAHKIRLCPNNKQAGALARACGCARFAFNWGLAEWKRQYAAGQKPNSNKLKMQFNAIKRQDFPFVLEVTKCACEQSFADLGNAFRGFFRNLKVGRKPGYPRFKRKGIRDSFYIANDKLRLEGKFVRIPKLGLVRLREPLRFEGKILSAVVSRVADMWFISVQVEQEVVELKACGPVLGVDVGVKALAVVSDGRTFENPKALRRAEIRLRRLQKSVSRKKKGSQNRKKAILKLQRQHFRVVCVRQDALHKATTAITTGCSVLVTEDLHVAGMLKNRRLSKCLSDASLAEFQRQLKYKSGWQGISLVKADRFYPSSKTCSGCGSVKAELSLSTRTYVCESCGLKLGRDLNAAINLRNLAVGSTVSACRLGSSGSSFEKNETTDWAGILHKSA